MRFRQDTFAVCLWLGCISCVLMMPASGGAAPSTAPAAKAVPASSPVPSAGELSQAHRRLEELLRATPEPRTPANLLKAARDTTSDSALRYVAAHRAMELAANEGDAITALAAMSDLAEGYACDALTLKVQLVSRLAQSKSMASAGILAMRFLDTALGERRMTEAQSLAALLTRARKELEPTLAAAADEVLADHAFAIRHAAPATTIPTSQPVTRPVGGALYACLYQNAWETQLPLLAQANSELASLAQADLAATDPAARLQAAEGWWEAGQKQGGRTGARITARAIQLYQQHLAHLDGVHRQLILTRIQQHERSRLRWQGYEPGLMRELWKGNSTGPRTRSTVATPALERNAAESQIPKSSAHVRFTGLLLASPGGRYELTLTAGTGLKLELDGHTLIDDPAAYRKRAGHILPLQLQPGLHRIDIEVWANSARPHLKLEWMPPYSGESSIVPAEVFFHDPVAK